jgi:2-oxoglutarate/2-oxoacid ferredoxin oxidoreductase subunit alpha
VILPENNMGQLVTLLRAKTLVDIKPYNRVTGQPFSATELIDAIETLGWGESA